MRSITSPRSSSELNITRNGTTSAVGGGPLPGPARLNFARGMLTVRHTPAGGTIEVTIANQSAAVEVSVKDNGCGIAPQHLPRVFDRFYRSDPSRSSEGVGLGLALVKSIMNLHGGTARIESDLGSGTKVTLVFPKS